MDVNAPFGPTSMWEQFSLFDSLDILDEDDQMSMIDRITREVLGEPPRPS